MRMAPALAAVAMALITSAAMAQEVPQRTGAHGLALPASFTGVLPCADCPGIRHQLDLWPEGGFALRQEYIDRDTVIESLGRWHVDPERRALVLSGEDAPQWQILGNGALRLLDIEGQPIESDLPYGLEPGPLDPFDVTLPMTGLFVYFADAALFTECLTGQRFPVLMEGEYIALERAYLEERAAPMAPLLSRIDGRISLAEAMEGPPRRSVFVDRLHHVTPDGGCPTERAPADLLNTYWVPEDLDGHPFPAGDTGREPYLLLLPGEERRFAATVGCNTLIGSFTHGDGTLDFGPAASTLMACPPGLDELETALGAVLAATAVYISDGHVLRLLDADGRILARLAAAHTPG